MKFKNYNNPDTTLTHYILPLFELLCEWQYISAQPFRSRDTHVKT